MVKFCTECGTKLNDEDLFCFNCGTKSEISQVKKKQSLTSSIMSFNLGKTMRNKQTNKIEKGREKVRAKISPVLPEYAKLLNVTTDKCYVTSIADTFLFKGTKHKSIGRDGVVMTIHDNKISYIVFAKIFDKIRYVESRDVNSISFKNIITISNKITDIELKMLGDNSINIKPIDFFDKNISTELLEKYNKFTDRMTNPQNNASPKAVDKAEVLMKYADLLNQGIITQEEFQKLKDELING